MRARKGARIGASEGDARARGIRDDARGRRRQGGAARWAAAGRARRAGTAKLNSSARGCNPGGHRRSRRLRGARTKSALAREEPRGVLPSAEEVGSGAGEAEDEQGESEGDVADRLERAPAVTAELRVHGRISAPQWLTNRYPPAVAMIAHRTGRRRTTGRLPCETRASTSSPARASTVAPVENQSGGRTGPADRAPAGAVIRARLWPGAGTVRRRRPLLSSSEAGCRHRWRHGRT